ncbi:unnamed protein product [Lepeophtheirus salmonis]|nr:unnamed protein product [Lepeophtheirus salmonis]CAF2843047.1 unnamed protein product [Lepeophtheirus salmonis]
MKDLSLHSFDTIEAPLLDHKLKLNRATSADASKVPLDIERVKIPIEDKNAYGMEPIVISTDVSHKSATRKSISHSDLNSFINAPNYSRVSCKKSLDRRESPSKFSLVHSKQHSIVTDVERNKYLYDYALEENGDTIIIQEEDLLYIIDNHKIH